MPLPDGFEDVRFILSPSPLPYRVQQQLQESYPDAEIIELTDSPEFVLNNRDWRHHQKALADGIRENCKGDVHFHLLTSGYSGLQLSSCMAAIMLSQYECEFSLMQWNPMHRRYFIVPYAAGKSFEKHSQWSDRDTEELNEWATTY